MDAGMKPILLLRVALQGVLGLALMLAAAGAVSAADSAGGKSLAVPIPTVLPPGELGKMVALGRDIVNNTSTHPLSRQYVGNSLSCSSCHLDGGTNPKALSFLGVASV
jgi:thiosulfate dehydrogenase